MGLEDLNNSLYRRGTEDTPIDWKREVASPVMVTTSAPMVEPEGDGSLAFLGAHTRAIRFGVMGFIALLIIGGGWWFGGDSIVAQFNGLQVTVTGPQQAKSGELVTYTLDYANHAFGTKKNVLLTPQVSGVFVLEGEGRMLEPLTLETLGLWQSGRLEFSGRWYGNAGDRPAFTATVSAADYAAVQSEQNTVLTAALADISMTGPSEVADGQRVEYRINITNTSEVPLENVVVDLRLPAGLSSVSVSSDFLPVEGKVVNWKTLPVGATATLNVRGNLNIRVGEVKTLGFALNDTTTLQSVATNEKIAKGVLSPVALSQFVNGGSELTVRSGAELRFLIRAQNQTVRGLRDGILKVKIDSPYIDYGSLKLPAGNFDQATKTVIFRASDVPALQSLAPGATAETTFSFALRSNLAAEELRAEGLTFETLATFDSADIPSPVGANKTVPSNVTMVRIVGERSISVQGKYTAGAMPMRVGESTEYTLRVMVSTRMSKLGVGRYVATLPTGVTYLGTADEYAKKELRYNDRTGEIVWEVGAIDPGREKSVSFRVQVTPSANQANQSPKLLATGVFTADDAFADERVRLTTPEKTTALPEDASVIRTNYTVKR
jgi:uncharacterized repeat protein (TIGR01451 family)